jgi:hypothetical protein
VAPTAIQRDLEQLDAEIKRLEAEYNMFFAGRLPRPPLETRSRVEALVKRYDRAHIQNYGDRFRFQSLQARFSAFADMWDRALRASEEGRRGPVEVVGRGSPPEPKPAEDRIVHVASFRDPLREIDKLQELYDSLTAARREVGDEPVPFDRFADLVYNRVARLKTEGSAEVAFRVAVKNGKVDFTARALKGLRE